MANKKGRNARNTARKKQTPQQKVDSPQESPKRWRHKIAKYTEHALVVGMLILLIESCFAQSSFKIDLRSSESELRNVKLERDELKTKLEGWKFSQPLYREIPGDIDFLVRNLKINKEEGAILRGSGPGKGDEYTFQITKLIERNEKDSKGDKQYSIKFRIDAIFDKNITQNVVSEPMLLKRLTLSKPLGAIPYEFYVFVEEVTIDSVYLTIARRNAYPGMKLSYNLIMGAHLANMIAPVKPPAPIILHYPEN